MKLKQLEKIRVYDNGGKTVDRFTVVFLDRPERAGLFEALGMDEQPFHPQGFGQHCTATPGEHLGEIANYFDLPADCQKMIQREFEEVAA